MLWCYDDSTHDVDEYQTSSQHSFLKGCPHQKLNVWRNTRCSNKTRILHGKITPFKGTTCAPALLQECCWCETLTALLESRLLGINEADIRESGNNNRKHMKTQPFFVLSKQLLHHIASPHLRLPQAAAPAPVLGSCEDFTRLGTLRRLDCLDCLECWHWWHWHWHPMKHATLRNHGGEGSWQNNVSCQFKVGTCHYINIINLLCVQHVVIDKSIETRWGYDKGWTYWNTLEHIGTWLNRSWTSSTTGLTAISCNSMYLAEWGRCCHGNCLKMKQRSERDRKKTWFPAVSICFCAVSCFDAFPHRFSVQGCSAGDCGDCGDGACLDLERRRGLDFAMSWMSWVINMNIICHMLVIYES